MGDGGPGRVGVIGSVTRPFCGTYDRVRLTADGQIRNCLFATTETDLRTLLRAGATDDQLAAAWRGALATKLPGHGEPAAPASSWPAGVTSHSCGRAWCWSAPAQTSRTASPLAATAARRSPGLRPGHAAGSAGPRQRAQLPLGISTETLVALTAAIASIPGSRPSSSAASRLSSDTNLCGPAWIST